MKTYFTSDHHFDHFNIIRYTGRPYHNIYEMNEDMVKRWNDTISKDDIVYYLGDFSLREQAVETWLSRLNYKEIHLYLGNHDKPFKSSKFIKKYIDWGFTSIQREGLLPIRIGGQEFYLSHFPYKGTGDHTYIERYIEERPEDKGKWLLCGHIHEKWKIQDKMINVGVDVWNGRPVSLEELVTLRNNPSNDFEKWS